MPKLQPHVVCAITFGERFTTDEDAGDNQQTIVGTFTGAIDHWGKHTIALLDSEAKPYYLFADEIEDVYRLTPSELAEAKAAILAQRKAHGLQLLLKARERCEAAGEARLVAGIEAVIAGAGA